MSARSLRSAFRVAAVAVAASLLSVSAGSAQQLLTPQQFQADPGQVLMSNGDGGAQLTSIIRQLAVADPKDLPLIITLLKTANQMQAAAIGSGLGQAALALVRTNQPYAAQIQQQLTEANNQDASMAFAAVTNNQQIGAVGGGGGGSAGGVGGQTNGLGGGSPTAGPQGIGGNGTATGSNSFSGGVASSAGSITGTGTSGTTTNLNISVSP